MNITKATKLKKLLYSPGLSFLMEAHNGLSAKVVEETGFEGIWASGLTISAQMGVRDANEVSWTQVLNCVELMADAVDIPILLDGDTGYGNFNNVRRLVRKLSQRDIAGVCLEDKIFPKKNSFVQGFQELASPLEFAGKIKAAKDTCSDSDFCVIARLEALIVGAGMQEALDRASLYQEAGADAILVHSKKSVATEIIEFAQKWEGNVPLVIVPTTYYATPTNVFEKIGISTIIWANHNLRSSLVAMRQVSNEIFRKKSIAEAESNIASINDVFDIVDTAELLRAEKIYLPAA